MIKLSLVTIVIVSFSCIHNKHVNAFIYPHTSFVTSQKKWNNHQNIYVSKKQMTSKNELESNDINKSLQRRMLFQAMTGMLIFMDHANANASASTYDKPQEFISVGTQAPTPDGTSSFIELSNGVQYKDIKQGIDSGSGTVTDKSTVQIQCSGRLLNLNGVSYYNTKNNNPDGFGSSLPLEIHLGQGEAIPGLEMALVGMKKGGIRRIIIPASMGYNVNQPNLEPKPTNANDQRALDSVLKNPRRDATILMDVSLERFK